MRGPQADEPFRLYAGGLGAAGHTEASGSKWYTAAGAEAAGGGKRMPRVMQGADVTFEGRGEAEEIDSWLMGAFSPFLAAGPVGTSSGFWEFRSVSAQCRRAGFTRS
jgi:hypothetical protein